jgi:hypothetical protein
VTSATLEQAREVTARLAADPVWFAEHILGHDVWGVPKAILQALAQPRARIAVKSCHSSSKTFTAAEAVLWAPFAGGIAITTAPTGRQVRRLVWQEVNAMHAAAPVPLGGHLLQTEYRIAADLYALGLATDKGVNFQGFHAREGGFLLVIMDEAPGIEPAVMAAIEGIRAGGDVRVLMLGNPDVPSGPFFDAFGEKGAGWTQLTIDGFDTPNLEDEEQPGHQLTLEELLALPEHRLDVGPRPYLITRQYIVEKWHEWGETSPLWQSKVLGRFPDQSEDSLLSLAWLEAAKRREIEPPASDVWEAGIDVAGPGEDETVVGVRHGPVIVAQKAWAQADPRGAVLDWLSPWKAKLSAVKVDSIGQGYYFARHLEDNGYKGRVVDVNVGESPANKERYVNLKAELYWGLRLRAQAGDMAGLQDDLTRSQLASIRYRHNARGQVEIESKDQAKRRGVKSPDRAEMIMLLFAEIKRSGWGSA